MILDTSAVVAILTSEAEADHFLELIAATPQVYISAASVLECHTVLEKALQRFLDQFIAAACDVVDVDAQQLTLARAAWNRYGRGSGSRAQLNYGDCFSYALAKSRDLPLLYKGEDFGHTDVKSARRGSAR